MTHPFFDAIEYPWALKEASDLHKALYKAIPTLLTIDTVYHECSTTLPPLALLGYGPDLVWTQALNNLAHHGFLKKLCEIVANMFPGQKEVQAPIKAVMNVQAASDVRIIEDKVLFINRANLRDQLKLLETDENPTKVLVIRGSPKSGKSYSRLLFEMAATQHGADPVYICDGVVATVEEVIKEIFSTLKATDKIPPKDTSDDAWYRAVCFALQEVASIKERQVWIAIDDLGLTPDGAPLLDTKIRNFCDQFALNLVNPAFRKWFRLMLIHYPEGPVPTKWKREIWAEDRTNESDLCKADVAQVLRVWSEQHDKLVVEEQLTTLAEEVINNAESRATGQPGELHRLDCVHDELIKAINKLSKGST